jgi:hypothetical protein
MESGMRSKFGLSLIVFQIHTTGVSQNVVIDGPVGMATSALVWGAVIYLLEYKTDLRPISRHRENFLSPFRSGTRRAQLGLA